MSYVDTLFHHLEASPDAIAFEFGDVALTFGQLNARARRYAAALSGQGIQSGDRVAVFLPTCIELVVALVGHYLAGVVHVPVNTRYGDVEIRHILADSGAVQVLHPASGELGDLMRRVLNEEFFDGVKSIAVGGVDADFARLVDGSSPFSGNPTPDDEDLAMLIYTSGTTGQSKGVELPYRAVVSNIDALTRLWQWTSDDALVLALPLFHVHGLCIGIHGTLIRGCRAILHDGFDAHRVAQSIADGATIFMGVPTMYARIVQAFDDEPALADQFKSARLFTSGSAALSAYLFERFEAATGHRILERYGMSETLLTLSNPYDGERRPGTVGKPVQGSQVRVVDSDFIECKDDEIGQIVVRGSSLMHGYWGLPDKTRDAFHDGWFITGDVARRSADGYIAIVGRSSVDIIKSGGYKISAREIEDLLITDDAVDEIAVVGIPDDVWGERIVAAVVTTADVDAMTLLERLQALGRAHLADYKTIRAIALMDALPRNALGKVQKHLLKNGTPFLG